MGFYGNITNTNKTTFQFDRIYSNRAQLEAGTNTDSIFLGRYVLIEYENGKSKDQFTKGIKYYSNRRIEESAGNYFTYSKEAGNQFEKEDSKTNNLNVDIDWIVYIDENKNTSYYICDGSDSEGYATFTFVTKTDSEYYANYQIDISRFGESKGFDSTVWTKTSITEDNQLKTKYVQIAELNTVVPTFDLTIDAPTSEPITPHFDTDSTNVYYKLHVQPNWGFQVGQATDGKSDDYTYWTKQVKDGEGAEQTYHTEYAVLDTDGKTIKWQTEKPTQPTIPATIYYNKAAFQPYQIENKTVAEENTISLLPTGYSGKKYNDHKKDNSTSEQADIQQLTINLPVIGNMISDAWDIIHGENRDDSTVDSLQGRLDFFTGEVRHDNELGILPNEIPVQSNEEEYLVGSVINGAKKRIVPIEGILNEKLSTSFEEDDAWIRTEIDTDVSNIRSDEDGNEMKYHRNGISIHHTFHAKKDTVSDSDVNSNGDTIELYTPKVDAAGHVVGKNIETVTLPYGYKTIRTNGLITDNNIDLDNSTGRESIADNTQDTLNINTVNKWLQIEVTEDTVELAHELHDIPDGSNGTTNLNLEINANNEDNINIPDWKYDNAGHIIEKHDHYYTLPFSYKTIKAENSSEVSTAAANTDGLTQTADTTQDELTLKASNKWIKLDIADEDTVKFGHLLSAPGIAKKHESLDKDIAEFGGSFNILNFTTDEAGHVTAVEQDTLTLPIGSLNDLTATGSSVITGLQMNDASGAITQTNDNVANLKLTDYEANTDGNITANDTIKSAFNKIERRVLDLDLDKVTSISKVINTIEQIDGKISVGSIGTDGLQISNYGDTAGYGTVANEQTINQALYAIVSRIKTEEDKRKSEIDLLMNNDSVDMDSIVELVTWVNTHGSEFATYKNQTDAAISANTQLINDNEADIEKKLSDEITRATVTEGVLGGRIDDLTTTVNNNKIAIEDAVADLTDYVDEQDGILNAAITDGLAAAAKASETYTKEEVNNLLAEKQDKIENLEEIINNLTSRIEALETIITPPEEV